MAGRPLVYGIGARALVVRLLLVSVLLAVMPGSAVSWLPGAAYAATSYYVDCSARVGGNGSQTSPWNNLLAANNTVFAPGDQILLRRGTRCVGELDPQGSGSSSAPIVVDAFGSGALPVIDASRRREAIKLFNQQYWEFHNLETIGGGSTAITITGNITTTLNHFHLLNMVVHGIGGGDGAIWVSGAGAGGMLNDVTIDGATVYNGPSAWGVLVVGATNVTVQNTTVHDVGKGGILVQDAGNVMIQDNLAYNTGTNATTIAADGIFAVNCHNCVIQSNETYNNHSLVYDGGDYDIDWGSDNTVVQYNYGHDSDGYCMAFYSKNGEQTSNGIFRYNVCANNLRNPNLSYSADVLLESFNSGGTSFGSLNNVQVYNNTFYHNPVADSAVLETRSAVFSGTLNLFENNLIYATNPTLIQANSMTLDHNLYWTTNASPPKWQYGTACMPCVGLSAYQQASGQDSHSLYGDPLLANPTYHNPGWPAGAFTLGAGSPAINAGANLCAWRPGCSMGQHDFYNNPIPQGRRYDIGASEYAITPTATSTPSPTATPTLSPTPTPVWVSQPSGSSTYFKAITCASSTICLAAGDKGAVFTTGDGGASWISRTTGVTDTLFGLSCATTSTCFTTSYSGSILRSDDSGVTWHLQSSGTTNTLYGISCPGPTTCFAAGIKGTILSTSDGGTTWIGQRTGTAQYFFGISCPDQATCYAVNGSGNVDVTTDGASTWRLLTTGVTSALRAIACPSTTACVAVGDGGTIVATTDGGSTWVSQSSGSTASLRGVACPLPGDCVAVGDGGLIVATTSAGPSWVRRDGGTTSALRSVACTVVSACYATGDSGMLLFSGVALAAPTATTTPTNTATATPTNTPTGTATPTFTSTPMPTFTPTGTPTWTPTPTPTNTPSGTPTASPTSTLSPTATATPTRRATATATASVLSPTPTANPRGTLTATPTRTSTRTATSTPTRMPTHSATSTPTLTATKTAGATPTNTSTATPTAIPTQTPLPALVASSQSYEVGDTAAITGSNFPALQSIKIYWDTSSTPPVATARSTLLKSFTAQLKVPPGHGGNHIIIAASSIATATITVQIYPKLTLSRYMGVSGTKVVASGSGFGPGEPVSLNWDSPPVTLGSTTTDALGSFTASRAITFTVPIATPAGHIIFAIGQTSGIRGVTDFAVIR